MGAIKTGWDFFQDQILGMHWLKDLIGNLLVKAGMGESRFPGEFLHFFIYDVIKIFVLLAVLIFLISYIQSYFPPERSRKILTRFHGVGANLIAALLGGVFVGVGVGLVVRAGGASGGDDVLALLLNKFTKLTLSKSYFMTDAIVLALSLTYIPAGRIVFSFITVTLSSFLIERIQRIGAPCAAAEQGA